MSSSPPLATRSNTLAISWSVETAAYVTLILALLALRVALWRYFRTPDILGDFLPWQVYLNEHGRWAALQHPISNYFPAYFDLAALTSYLDGYMNRVSQIKLISFCFDGLTALVACFLVGQLLNAGRDASARRLAQKIAPLCILAGPTVILNGAAWGQSDIVFTCFLLLSTSAVVGGEGALAALFFGCALALKLQAVFLLPFLGAMLLQRRIRLWHLPFALVGWIAAVIPALMHGASLRSEFSAPFSQGREFATLAINVGNPWTVAELAHVPYRFGTTAGIVVTLATGLAILFWGSRPAFRTPKNTFALACFSLLVMPYVMPKMHDRYFFSAEVFLSIISCVEYRFALPAGLVISASLICYSNYFLQHVRYSVLAFALLANTLALLLVFLRLRLSTERQATADRPQVPEEASPGYAPA